MSDIYLGELLPCPLCGEAEADNLKPEVLTMSCPFNGDYEVVQCPDCGLTLHSTKGQKLWNTRPNDAKKIITVRK